MSAPQPRNPQPIHVTGWVSAVTLLGGLLILSGAVQHWGLSVVFTTQAATATAAVGIISTHPGSTAQEHKIAATSLLLIVLGVAAAAWTLTTGSAWPTILTGAAQLGWATGPARQHKIN